MHRVEIIFRNYERKFQKKIINLDKQSLPVLSVMSVRGISLVTVIAAANKCKVRVATGVSHVA